MTAISTSPPSSASTKRRSKRPLLKGKTDGPGPIGLFFITQQSALLSYGLFSQNGAVAFIAVREARSRRKCGSDGLWPKPETVNSKGY